MSFRRNRLRLWPVIQPDMALRNPFALMAMAALLAGMVVVHSSPATAQTQDSQIQNSKPSDPKPLPDAPDSTLPPRPVADSTPQPPDSAPSEQGQQTKRILWILPNFTSVSADTHLPAQTPKEKFKGFEQDSFDYSSFAFVGILAGVSQLQASTPEFHNGASAYGRYYWHSFTDQTDENLWVDFLLPVTLHQDARYYTLGSGSVGESGSAGRAKQDDGHTKGHNGFAKRAGYAFTRILITRTDSGGSNFNYSEIVGAGTAAGLSNLYYPSSDRGWNKTGQRWALNVGLDGATFIFKEFWPDLNHALFHTK